MTLLFSGCPIYEGEIKVEEKCLFCEHYTGNYGDFFYVLKWCKHPDIIKNRI